MRPSRIEFHQHTSPKQPLWLCFLASAGCWCALRAPGVPCFVFEVASSFGGREKLKIIVRRCERIFFGKK
jgi:hypothetical protein